LRYENIYAVFESKHHLKEKKLIIIFIKILIKHYFFLPVFCLITIGLNFDYP